MFFQPDLKYENCSTYTMEIHMKFKRNNNEEYYKMPLLGLENVTLYSMGDLSLTFNNDNDMHCRRSILPNSVGPNPMKIPNFEPSENRTLNPSNRIFDMLPTKDDNQNVSESATSNNTILIVAVVCGIILVTTIVGIFFIRKNFRENKEMVAGKVKNNELDDFVDMEQQQPIVKQISK